MFDFQRYLELRPKARERKYKNKAIGAILMRKYNIEDMISMDDMEQLVKDVTSMSRQWRKVLEDNPELRGEDYDKKDKLVAQTQRELGYNV